MSASTNFDSATPYPGTCLVHLGDGSSLSISHVGTSTLHTSTRPLSLSQLLHVPMITKNLLSVSRFTKDNYVFFEFHYDYCCVKDEKTGATLLQGTQSDGLYHISGQLRNKPVMALSADIASSSSSSFWRWHRRLGH
ncbi:hypothetical protein GQ457_07G014140 [Hibiscus cannabinus]